MEIVEWDFVVEFERDFIVGFEQDEIEEGGHKKEGVQAHRKKIQALTAKENPKHSAM
jgi:hypothetical protein